VTARELVNVSQAAQRIGRPRTTIQGWIYAELLFPAGLDQDSTPLYAMADVRRVAATRPRRRRRRNQGGSTHG
jgi:hypothetical protein